MCDGTSNQNMVTISVEDIQNLLNYFSKNTYRAKEADSVVRM